MSRCEVELLDVRPVAGADNVKAFVTVRIGGVTIHGAKVVQQPGQAAWLAMPDRSYTDAGGKRKWSAVVELSPELRRRVSDTILAEWERRCAPAAPPQPAHRPGVATACGAQR